MAYPSIIFNTISEWENYLNTEIVLNGNEDITGLVGNNAYNGAVTFIKKSPINWLKAAVYSGGGDISLSNNFLGVALFMTVSPDSLSFGDNFYNQYVFLNMTSSSIPLSTPSVYYDMGGNPINEIPSNSAVTLFKASNDLWVLAETSSGGGGGSTQKEPKTYIVGTTSGAPTAGTSTWVNADFANSYITLFINRGGPTPGVDPGDGGAYTSKPSLASTTLNITNYQWTTGDILQYILITP